MVIELSSDEVSHVRFALLMRAAELKQWCMKPAATAEDLEELQALDDVIRKLNA